MADQMFILHECANMFYAPPRPKIIADYRNFSNGKGVITQNSSQLASLNTLATQTSYHSFGEKSSRRDK